MQSSSTPESFSTATIREESESPTSTLTTTSQTSSIPSSDASWTLTESPASISTTESVSPATVREEGESPTSTFTFLTTAENLTEESSLTLSPDSTSALIFASVEMTITSDTLPTPESTEQTSITIYENSTSTDVLTSPITTDTTTEVKTTTESILTTMDSGSASSESATLSPTPSTESIMKTESTSETNSKESKTTPAETTEITSGTNSAETTTAEVKTSTETISTTLDSETTSSESLTVQPTSSTESIVTTETSIGTISTEFSAAIATTEITSGTGSTETISEFSTSTDTAIGTTSESSTTVTSLETLETTTETQTPTATPSPLSCSTPVIIEDFSNGSEINNFGGYSGTDGSGTYQLQNGQVSWTPIIGEYGAYWFTQTFPSTSSESTECHNFSDFGKKSAFSITIGKTTTPPATLTIGVDIGCTSAHTFYELGTIQLESGSVYRSFEVNMFPALVDVVNLRSIKAVLIIAQPSVEGGTNFVIGGVKVVCSANPPLEYCGPNGGGMDLERVPGVRPRVVERCMKPGQFALTFDDGPKLYENDLVNRLNALGVKVTFFMNTNNWVDATTEPYATWIRNAYNSGHQIASHAATHTDLATLNQTGITTELLRAESAFYQILGIKPAMVRPPYGSFNELVLSTIDALNYTAAVLWNLDTNDWQHPNDLQLSINAVKNLLEVECPEPGSAAVIDLSHSTLAQSLQFIEFVVPYVLERGYKFVTIAECLGMDAYK
ncbi:Carbohydrate esterase 4 protein [Nowakowskiella sp. JEL0407]|nr:Carbohydrate esterase 4 protein [Nowakowskiella sp. JEL0407]